MLIIFLWHQSVIYVTNKGLGYLFVIGLAIFSSVFPEARISIMFLPIIIIPTIEYIDTLMLRKWVAPIYAVLSILLSHIWFPINVDGIENAFQDESFMGLSNFPAQRFFMCSGIWQSDDMYVVFMLITIVFGSVFYVGCKRKWFIELDNAGL